MQAVRDENRVTSIVCVSSADGVTPIAVKADPTEHYIIVDDNTTGSDLSGEVAVRDQNLVTAWVAVSSVDGVTPVPVYASVNGELLVDSTP